MFISKKTCMLCFKLMSHEPILYDQELVPLHEANPTREKSRLYGSNCTRKYIFVTPCPMTFARAQILCKLRKRTKEDKKVRFMENWKKCVDKMKR